MNQKKVEKRITRKHAERMINKPKWKHSLACYLDGFQCYCFDIPRNLGYNAPPPYLKLKKELKLETV